MIADQDPVTAAEQSAAAGFPPDTSQASGPVPPAPPKPDDDAADLSAEEAQAEALNVVDEEPPVAVAGEEVASAEEVLPPEDTKDYKDLYLRASADMENFRKRSRRDVGLAQERGIGKLAKELLPAIDNLERALQAAEAAEGQGEHVITKGIRLVQAEFVGALTRAGITIEDPKGQPFDPHRHEALAQAPVEGVAPGVVTEVYQPGYVLGEQVLRAARVVVSGG